MSDMDSKAAFSSEIFRIYANNELIKEKALAEKKSENEILSIEAFEEFQNRVNASPKLRTVFKKLQQTFMTDEKSTSKVDPKFVQGVLLLNIDGE
jgi:hypothetical protein